MIPGVLIYEDFLVGKRHRGGGGFQLKKSCLLASSGCPMSIFGIDFKNIIFPEEQNMAMKTVLVMVM